MEIYALFSVENNYDQPDNNLVELYEEKPSVNYLLDKLYSKFYREEYLAEITKEVEAILRGEQIRIEDTDFRIEKVSVR